MDSFKVLDNGQVMRVQTIPGGADPAPEYTIESHYDMFYHVELTTDKTEIVANDIDAATVTAKVFDYLNNPVAYEGDITFSVEDDAFPITAENGVAIVQISSDFDNVIDVYAWVPNSRSGGLIINAATV